MKRVSNPALLPLNTLPTPQNAVNTKSHGSGIGRDMVTCLEWLEFTGARAKVGGALTLTVEYSQQTGLPLGQPGKTQ